MSMEVAIANVVGKLLVEQEKKVEAEIAKLTEQNAALTERVIKLEATMTVLKLR